MINPIRLDDPRLQKGLEALAKRLQPKETKLPYYNEEQAKNVKVWLDKLHLNGESVRITAGAPVTTRLKYYQGVKYLYDKLHPEYKEIYHKTKCVTYNTYIELTLRNRRRTTEEEMTATFRRDELLDFVETSERGNKFHKKVILSDEDIHFIKTTLQDLTIFVFSVDNNEVKIIRVE